MVKIVLIILFTLLRVRGDENGSFYVVEMPESEARGRSLQKFQVYWNVPTMQCRSKGVPFPDLNAKYGIFQNKGDRFQGEHVTILYDPGRFPALLQNGTELIYRNGGVPQEGDIDLHLKAFQKILDSSVPESFRGLGIIDFESWRPIFRQNFGNLSPYKDISYEIEKRRHPFWPQSWVQDEAVSRFEEAGQRFMLSTLQMARRLRPRGSWGYYGFPYCFNMGPANKRQQCAARVPEENDKMAWLWQESTALYPSLYSSKSLNTDQLQKLIRGRVLEAKRLRGKSRILPYFWYKYRDGGFITATDLKNSLATLHKSSAAGIILWGSSNDVNTKDKCDVLLDYVENTLGPMIAKYTKTERQAREDDRSQSESEELIQNVEEDDIEFTEPKNELNKHAIGEVIFDAVPERDAVLRSIPKDALADVKEFNKESLNLKESNETIKEIPQIKHPIYIREKSLEISKDIIEYRNNTTKIPLRESVESRDIAIEIRKEKSKEYEKLLSQLVTKNLETRQRLFRSKSFDNVTAQIIESGKDNFTLKLDDASDKKLNQIKTVSRDKIEAKNKKGDKESSLEESKKELITESDSKDSIRKSSQQMNKFIENVTTQIETTTPQVSSACVIELLPVLWVFNFLVHHHLYHLSL